MFGIKCNGLSRMLLVLISSLLFLEYSFQEEIPKCCRQLGGGLLCPGCNLTELHFLSSFESIVYLDLHDNKLKELHETSFQNLLKLEDVDLSKNMINAISEETFSNLKELKTVILNSNLIYNITSLHLPSAIKLYLGMNPLMLDKNYLGPSGNELKELDLTSCNLDDFYSKTLENCPKITKLVLKRNRITILNSEWFTTNSIEYLDVSFNNIRTINERKQLPNLHELDLSFNNLVALSSIMFDFAPNLKILNLEGNDIKTLPNGPIFVHGSLENLILARCFIRRMQSESLSKLPNLKKLDLRRNVLMDVENIFRGSWSLEELYLSENYLTCLNPDTFSGLDSLQQLLLDGNEELQEFNTSVVDNLRALRLLNVSRTAIACDCSASYWSLHAWAATTGVILVDECVEELPCGERPTTVTTWDPDTSCFKVPEVCGDQRCCLNGKCSVKGRCGAATVTLQKSLLVIFTLIVLRLR